jgi:hypothetical protein
MFKSASESNEQVVERVDVFWERGVEPIEQGARDLEHSLSVVSRL